jgi:multiple sugar transport system substrate-binding protein
MFRFNGRRAISRGYLVLALSVVVALLVAWSLPPSAEAGARKTKVVYWGHNFVPRVELDKKYIAEFLQKNPDIDVEYEPIPTDFDAKLRTALAAGTGPDLFAQWNGDMGTFYAQGTIVPVDYGTLGFASQRAFMDLYVSPENILQGAIFNGVLYGIPNEVSIYACYVNKKHFQEPGLDPDRDFPTTWEDMVAVSQKLVKRDASGKLIQRGFDFDWGSSVWMYLQWGAMVRQLGGSELKVANSPEAEKTMQYWADWANKHRLGGPAYWTGQGSDFTSGSAAIKCALGSWAKPGVEQAKIDYTVKKVPIWRNAKNKNHFDTYAYFHMVNARSARVVQQAAWKLAYYLDSFPVDYLVNTGLLQPRKELPESREFRETPYLNLFLEEMEVSMYSPRVPRFIEIADALMRARDRSVVEGMAINRSLATAQREIDEIMAQK